MGEPIAGLTGQATLRLFAFRPLRLAFDVYLRDTMIPEMARLPGLCDLYAGRQGPDELGERVVVSIWQSHEAMADAVGTSFDTPVFHPEQLAESADRRLEILPLAFGFHSGAYQPMGILRIVRGMVQPSGLDAYVDAAAEGTRRDSAAGHGPLALYLATQGTDRFVTVSVWSGWESVEAATGADRAHPIATRRDERLLEWSAAHYELIPTPLMPGGPGSASR